jgi:hypothetical protein
VKASTISCASHFERLLCLPFLTSAFISWPLLSAEMVFKICWSLQQHFCAYNMVSHTCLNWDRNGKACIAIFVCLRAEIAAILQRNILRISDPLGTGTTSRLFGLCPAWPASTWYSRWRVQPRSFRSRPRLVYCIHVTCTWEVMARIPTTLHASLISSADKSKLHYIVCIECIHEHRTSPPSRRTYTALSALC